MLLLRDSSFNVEKKKQKKTIVLNATIQYTFDANRFDVPWEFWKLHKFQNLFTVLSVSNNWPRQFNPD